MKDGNRFIFRDTAIRHYALGRARAVLPQFASTRLTTLLWVLTGILFGAGVLTWFIRIPVYASGVGVGDGYRIAVFLPDTERFRVHVGQRAFCTFDKTGGRVGRTLIAIDSQVSSPADVHTRFKLTDAVGAEITKPVVIAFVNLEPLPGNLPASAYAGSVYRVDVEVGMIRAISLLPFVNRFSQ
jgi:hypothetical protein